LRINDKHEFVVFVLQNLVHDTCFFRFQMIMFPCSSIPYFYINREPINICELNPFESQSGSLEPFPISYKELLTFPFI
jgi:hypothetical protein